MSKTRQVEGGDPRRDMKSIHSLMFDNFDDAIYLATISGRFIQVNEAACRQLGCTGPELLAMSMTDVSTKPSLGLKRLMKTIKNQGEFVYESEHRRRDGTVFPVEIHLRAITHEGQEMFLAIVRDITRRKQMERAFEENESLHRTIVGTIPDIIIQTEMDGTIVFANEVAIRYGGFAGVEDLLGRNVFSFIAPEDQKMAADNTKLMLTRQLGPHGYKLIFRPGEENYFELNGGVLRGSRGNPCGMVFLCRDVTERKQVEINLQKRFIELQNALAHIKTLQGILPICSYCHRIRNDKEVWERLENYISQHTEAQFSHGLCPECMKKHFPTEGHRKP
jgi:PAS domain S-box-containing protein